MSVTINLTINEAGNVRTQQCGLGAHLVGRDPACELVISSPDVSRQHARLTFGEKSFLVEDLGSTSGTAVNGGWLSSARRFSYPQTVEFGSVVVRVRMAGAPLPAGVSYPADESPEESVNISVSLDAKEARTPLQSSGVAEQVAQRLMMLYQLPLELAAVEDLRSLYKRILSKVMELIPGAKRGALLTVDPGTEKLLLRASIPEDSPPITRTLIKRVASSQHGFIWDEQGTTDRSESMVSLGIRTGMYVPLLWKGQTLGVLCVDNPKHRAAFRQEDLQFMISVANYAAAAVANQVLQDDIASSNRTLQGLLANFSPKLRRKLLQKAREGALQPGGENSNVTILMSDLRGFTRTAATVDSRTVLHMLNDYFSVLGDIIFQHDGTIDKFIGDAILAVFGSPEPDEEHALKAVRCALAMQEAMQSINAARRSASLPTCELGIGIHTGEVLHGFIGAAERMEFTVIGDTVNKACRYCDGAKPGGIVLGRATHQIVQLHVPCDETRIATKHVGDLAAFIVKETLTTGSFDAIA
jgi:adenylate cyclase